MMCHVGDVGVKPEKSDKELANRLRHACSELSICIEELRKRGYSVTSNSASWNVYSFEISKKVSI